MNSSKWPTMIQSSRRQLCISLKGMRWRNRGGKAIQLDCIEICSVFTESIEIATPDTCRAVSKGWPQTNLLPGCVCSDRSIKPQLPPYEWLIITVCLKALRVQGNAGTMLLPSSTTRVPLLLALLGVRWRTGGRPAGEADSGGQRALGEKTSCGGQMGVLWLAVRTGGPLSPHPSKQVASSPLEVTFTHSSAKPPCNTTNKYTQTHHYYD